MKKYKTGYFDIDHPILNVILKIILWIVGMIISFIIVAIFFSLIMLTQDNCYEGSKIFKYEDLNGNIGMAYNCQYTDKSHRSGGMGEPICFAENKVVVVKWYEDRTQYKSCKKIIFGGDK